jgi:hypothetical protein
MVKEPVCPVTAIFPGTVATAGLLLVSATLTGAEGRALRVTMPVVEALPVTSADLKLTLWTVTTASRAGANSGSAAAMRRPAVGPGRRGKW